MKNPDNKKPHHKDERILVIIKPDGVQRTLIGEIIKRYERTGLKLVGLKMLVPPKELVEKHYVVNPDWYRSVGEKNIKGYAAQGKVAPTIDPVEFGHALLKRLVGYLTSGPVVVMAWQGAHAIKIVRKLTGGTEPLSSDVGTIRGDYVLDSYVMSDTDNRAIRNLIHSSGTLEEAEAELRLWFKPEELHNYRLAQEAILYDVNLDGILE